MSAKSSKPKKVRSPWEVQFIQCDLDNAAKLELKSWNISASELLEKMGDMLDDGYKISLSQDKDAQFVGAYATTKNDHTTNPQMCLGGRGATIIHAIKSLLFKHYVLLEQTWGGRVRKDTSEEEYL